MIGRVTSTKMQKTAVVLIERVAMHPLYKKTFRRSKKYLADDPIGVKDGDLVEIIKVSPVSKNKHWRVTKVLGQSLAEIVEAQQKVKAEEEIAQVMPASPTQRGEPENSSENSENSENQKVSISEDQTSGISDSSDKSGKPSNSESSEKKKVRKKREAK